MAILTVCNIPNEVHRALRVRAAVHGRSTEAEVRAILEEVVLPKGRIGLGSKLSDVGRRIKLTDEEFEILAHRDHAPAKSVVLE